MSDVEISRTTRFSMGNLEAHELLEALEAAQRLGIPGFEVVQSGNMKRKIGLVVSALVIVVSAGGLALAAQSNDDGDIGANIGMPNPASVFCEEQGGTVEIVTDEDGNQLGICQLADGTQIDEWEYWRQFQGSGVDAPEVGEAPETGGPTPLAPQGITEPDLSDPVLFIEGEPGYPADTLPVYDQDANPVPNPQTQR